MSRVWGRHSPTRFRADKFELQTKFDPAVESCSKPHHLYRHIKHTLFFGCIIALLLQIEREIMFAKFTAICGLIILALYASSQI